MTVQLTLGDCDPAWKPLCGQRTEQRHTPTVQRPSRDLLGQHLNRRGKYRITDVHIVGEYL